MTFLSPPPHIHKQNRAFLTNFFGTQGENTKKKKKKLFSGTQNNVQCLRVGYKKEYSGQDLCQPFADLIAAYKLLTIHFTRRD